PPLPGSLAIWPYWAPTVEQHGTGSCGGQSPPYPQAASTFAEVLSTHLASLPNRCVRPLPPGL
ncbi:hypothetical protein JOQ06_012114, partial [Pogonophryne albipinna]